VKIPNALLRAEPSSKVALIKLSVLERPVPRRLPGRASEEQHRRRRRHSPEVMRRENRESDDEHSTSPEDVARSTTEEQEASEGQAVGVDDPRESAELKCRECLMGTRAM